MIGAFARTARALGVYGVEGHGAGHAYLEQARRAARFVQARMWVPATSTLLRRYRQGHAEIDGYAEDYAYLISGLLELFQADPDPTWLSWAIALQHRQDELFWDENEAGWFSTTGQDPTVLLRMKDDYDGAEPTASSVSVGNLLVLSHLVEEPRWIVRIERTFRLFASRLEGMGRMVPMMAAALSAYTAGPRQVVLIAEDEGGELGRAVSTRHLPFATVLRLTPAQQAALADTLPIVAAMRSVGRDPTVYICRNSACLPPATTVEAFDEGLRTRLVQ
jgi:uncharacterized protein YyaL (SSP411 family)